MNEVEVEMYSGRPNPRFVLSGPDTRELQQRLQALPPAPEAAAPRDDLGYRGLRITGPTAPGAEVVVSAGTVEVRDATGKRRLADPGRLLERWLIAAASTRLQQGELDAVLQDLER